MVEAVAESGVPKDKWKEFVESVKVLAGTPRVVALVWRCNPMMACMLLAATITVGSLPTAELFVGKLIIDSLVIAVENGQTNSLHHLGFLVALIGVVRLVTNLCESASKALQEQMGELVTREINLLIFNKINSFKDLTRFEQPEFHDKLTRAQDEAGYRPNQTLVNLLMFIRGTASLVTVFTVLFVFSPVLTLLVVAISLPNLVAQFRMDWEAWQINNYQIPEVRRMHYFRSTMTNLSDAKEIRLFNLGDFFLGKYMEKFDQFQARQRAHRLKRFTINSLLSGLAAIGQSSAYFYIIYRAALGSISLGSVSLYLSAVNQLENGMANMVYTVSSLYSGNLFLNNLFEFLATDSTMSTVSVIGATIPVPDEVIKGIRFENVSFKYPDADRIILDDVSFRLKPGESVALVGENGAGKSTIVKLLTRLYTPSAGRILVDEIDIRDFDIDEWRTKCSVILQDFSHYHMPARDNVGIGSVALIGDLERIKSATERANAGSVIEKLPDSYDTLLGRYFNEDHVKAADLSGGEWQKLALARAYMRSDSAELLILDEPTAALDAQAEYEVFLRFHELTQGKISFLISHRFSTVKMADVIMVLEKGKIIETGSHTALMAESGTYARLYNLQADRYK